MQSEGFNAVPTLTLSMGGVSFSLIPDTQADQNGGTVQFQNEGPDILLSFQNYSGTLRVAYMDVHVTPKRKLEVVHLTSEETSKKVREALDDEDDDDNVSVATEVALMDTVTDECNSHHRLQKQQQWNQSLPETNSFTGSASLAHSQSPQPAFQDETSQDPTLLGQTQQSQLRDSEENILDDGTDKLVEKNYGGNFNNNQEAIFDTDMIRVHETETADKPARVSLGREQTLQQESGQVKQDGLAPASGSSPFASSIVSISVSTATKSDLLALSLNTKEAPARVSIPATSTRYPSMLSAPAMPTKKQDAPCARWGHTLTDIGNGRLLLYGGQTIDHKSGPRTLHDVHIYDMEKSHWFEPFNCQGYPRQWHTITFLPERQLLICFGGEGRIPNDCHVMVLDTEIMLWYPPTVTGDAPSSRSGHTATRLDSNLVVVFGGVKGRKWLNTVHVLDCTVWKWIAVKVAGTAPPPRSYHTAVTVGTNRMIVFGGNNADQCFDSVHVLEKTCSTVDTGCDSSVDCWRWSHPTTTGFKPVARTGHSATVLEDGKTVLVYGGWDPNADDDDDDGLEETIFDDYYLLDTETWKWRNEGSTLTKRVGHAAVWQEERKQVVAHGGRTVGNAFTNDFEFFGNC